MRARAMEKGVTVSPSVPEDFLHVSKFLNSIDDGRHV